MFSPNENFYLSPTQLFPSSQPTNLGTQSFFNLVNSSIPQNFEKLSCQDLQEMQTYLGWFCCQPNQQMVLFDPSTQSIQTQVNPKPKEQGPTTKYWTIKDDIALTNAFIFAAEDTTVDVYQNHENMFMRIFKEFQNQMHGETDRNYESAKRRLAKIKKCSDYSSCIDKACNRPQSGANLILDFVNF